MVRLKAKIGKPFTWVMQVIIILFSFTHSLHGKDFAHRKMKGIKLEVSRTGTSSSFENQARTQKENHEEITQGVSFDPVLVQLPQKQLQLAKPFIEINFYERNFFYVYNSQSAP